MNNIIDINKLDNNQLMQLANFKIYKPIPNAPIMGRASSPSVLRVALNRREKKAIAYGLSVLSITSLCFLFVLGTIFVQSDLETVSDPLRDIRLAIRRMDKEKFFNRLSLDEKRKVATQVHFVSEIISRNSKVTANKELALAIVNESIRANVDPLLVTALVKSESTFKSSAISNKGALGLMQLLPATAHFTAERITGTPRLSRRNLHHIDYNLQIGIAYLKHLEELFAGNRELALIAYNWGPGNLKNALKNKTHIPEETRTYARKIIRNHSRWQSELQMFASNFQYLNINKIA